MYGVRENFEVNDEFIVSNFLKKDGIKGHFSQSDLYKILK
jgi:hypothetical protein